MFVGGFPEHPCSADAPSSKRLASSFANAAQMFERLIKVFMIQPYQKSLMGLT